MAVKVKVELQPLLKLRQRAPDVLAALDKPMREFCRQTLSISQLGVSRSEVEYDESGNEVRTGTPLVNTTFIDGPEHHLDRRLSSTWTAGYDHPAAGAIHQGFHWGEERISPPPLFLKRAFKVTRSIGRADIKKAVQSYLKKILPPK
ncbi:MULTISPECIES: hypothetical protein [unclassified Corallococcus]|uniref:hypothetical protein n=1 Tax=unclassified Corallococcus TaxID=2685029 RepID=UPI001A8D0DA2|nr:MULTISPECIES: hypothetical protein [unclassified Corallococcus]MBN9687123.1 hypothetical protein [Corallococcus sp. NCSPR001]WAS89049.1 hypothetical protein O0N60_19205 [Corallococcus sp. NCRR]